VPIYPLSLPDSPLRKFRPKRVRRGKRPAKYGVLTVEDQLLQFTGRYVVFFLKDILGNIKNRAHDSPLIVA
jgi:hypothetical protein